MKPLAHFLIRMVGDNDWQHIFDFGTGTNQCLFLTPKVSTATGSIAIDPAAIAPTINSLADSQYASDPLLNGVLDDFCIYSRGLSAAEVTVLAMAPAAIAVPDSSYAGWSGGIAFPAGQSGAMLDPDEDGLNNAWEYVFGT